MTITDSIQPVSTGMYVRRGLIPTTLILTLSGAPRCELPAGLGARWQAAFAPLLRLACCCSTKAPIRLRRWQFQAIGFFEAGKMPLVNWSRAINRPRARRDLKEVEPRWTTSGS
jgi:hypothetical protein